MTSRARQTPLARCFSVVHWFEHLLPPKLPADSLRAVEMVVLLLPTQILPSSRLTEPRGWLPERPGESLCALEMVVLLLPTQILPSSRLTEPRELLPDWPQPLVKLLRLSPQALVFGALEKLPSARPAEARWQIGRASCRERRERSAVSVGLLESEFVEHAVERDTVYKLS